MDQRTIRREARELVKAGAEHLLTEESWEPDTWEPEIREYRGVYLGTVFAIMPSGKYYMPWACSNVEPCSRCKGQGCDFCGHLGSREAFEDDVMNEALQEYASKLGLCVEAGEGDPCDLFLNEYRDLEGDE
jgi:hypothetical protein